MTPALLQEAGNALYGARWQSDLARDLGVSDRTVRRWSAGDFRIPAPVWVELREMLRGRRMLLASVTKKLPR